jgi:hypothetical protein
MAHTTEVVPAGAEERRALAATFAAGYSTGRTDMQPEDVFGAYRTFLKMFDDRWERQRDDARKGR